MHLALVIALAAAALQQPQVPAATFRSGIDVVRLDVSVLDGQGRPVPDLAAADFSVTVDGRERKVLFARFVGVPAGASSVAAPSGVPASYATNTTSAGGRAIVFVVDLESIRAGNEKLILDTAARLADALPAGDAIAVVPIPGTSIDLTRDHVMVSNSLRTLRGVTALPIVRHAFSMTEAIAFERGDARVIAEVIDRECDPAQEAARKAAGRDPLCPPELRRETREYLAYHRVHTRDVLRAISSVAERLTLAPVPRSLVLISAGLAFEPESLGWYREMEIALKRAAMNVYALHVDQPDFDATGPRLSDFMRYQGRDHQTGVASVATMTGGEFFAAVGTASGALERVRARIASSYELAIEALPSDDDGKSHAVHVAVPHPGATLRWRKELASPRRGMEPSRRLAELMGQPLNVPELPITASLYSVRGEEAATLKTVVAATFGEGVAIEPPVQYALALRRDNKAVFETNGTAMIEDGYGRTAFAAQIAPGAYTMRIAVIDGTGRGGSLETPVRVGLRAAGDFQLSDVILRTAAQTGTPVVKVAAGAPLSTALELYAADPSRFPAAAVQFEVRRGTDQAVVASTPGILAPTELERRQVAEGAISTGTLAPGEYTMSAVVSANGQPIAKVSRTFAVTEPAPAAAAPDIAAAPVADLPAAPLAADAALDQMLRKLSRYVAGYGERASVLVGVEKYTQEVSLPNVSTVRPRRLVAEFALVKTGGAVGWTGFRDVVEVNGDAVQDRRDRLMKLLTEPSGTADDVRRIADESARYNVGPIARNFNVPTTALFFFHPANVSRFKFTRKGSQTINGVSTSEIAFRETAKPTLISTRAGKDVPVEGTVWVVPEDGTVVRTRLRLRGFADATAASDARAPSGGSVPSPTPPSSTSSTPAPATSTTGGAQPGGSTSPGPGGGPVASPAPQGGAVAAPSPSGQTAGDARSTFQPMRGMDFTMTRLESLAEIEVTYRRDESAGMWLPARMSEQYEGAILRVRGEPVLGTSRTIATYSDFKKFETSAKIVAPK